LGCKVIHLLSKIKCNAEIIKYSKNAVECYVRKGTPSLCMSQKEKIEHTAASPQSESVHLVEATSMAARQDRLGALQNGSVGAGRASSNCPPDDAALVAETELVWAVTDNGAVSGALTRAAGAV
jgi:hypothetical protein